MGLKINIEKSSLGTVCAAKISETVGASLGCQQVDWPIAYLGNLEITRGTNPFGNPSYMRSLRESREAFF